ncbi:predicted protein [Chaetoceros tenuissimus]|uniref:Uncharacterized protein n=1 Tax=Chaetoceros tenuissimus TaxID=426638 RepID=A0AAD3HGA1_9STRA|nr:predicted protein [Chaetoceros tenuissimus]
MTKSQGQVALSVLEDVLVAEISSENRSIQEHINNLKTCQEMLEKVDICIGKKCRTYSIVDGKISHDESHVLKFTIDHIENDLFKIPELIGTTREVPFVAALFYAGSMSVIDNDSGKEFSLYLKATEDDCAVFSFCQERVTFQGTLHNIGPQDMARGIEGLTNQIRKAIKRMSERWNHRFSAANTEVEVPEFHMNDYFHDSPDLMFVFESFSIQFTPEVSRAYGLARKIKEANIPKVNSIDSTDLTASDALRSQVAMSLVHGKLVDGLRVNKQLRCELKSLCYMKSLLQSSILKYDGEILCEINLNEGMMYPDFLREIGRAHSITDGPKKDLWMIPLREELSLEMNSLDKFTVTIGPNRHFEASGNFVDRARDENEDVVFKIGRGAVNVFGEINCSPHRLRQVLNEEDFAQKLSKATLPGVSADFPELFKITFNHICIQSHIIKRFLDIGK